MGAPVWSASFDRYGAVLATGGADEAVCLWDAAKGGGAEEEGGMGVGVAVGDAGGPPPGPLRRYATRNTPVIGVHWTRTNLLWAMGEYVTVKE